MSDLKLDSLRIQNFRTFKDLTIDRLGRVNLIVGKNNVGKTALLEGIWLWGHPEFWQDLAEFLEMEFPINGELPKRGIIDRRYEVLKPYFHGYPDLSENPTFTVEPGPIEKGETLVEVSIVTSGDRNTLHGPTKEPPYPRVEITPGPWVDSSVLEEFSTSRVSLKDPQQSTRTYNLEDRNLNLVPSDGLVEEDASQFWDDSIRLNVKERVLSVIRTVVPSIEDINWIDDPSINVKISGETLWRIRDSDSKRVPMVSLKGEKKTVPLSTLGEGTSRALWIGSALVNSGSGLLLVDEIENGLHYSVQPDLWRMIFETAQELDVQVFATTHSYDCVQAFEQVAQNYDSSDSMLVSLRRREKDPKDIVAVPSDRDELATVVEEDIEIR